MGALENGHGPVQNGIANGHLTQKTEETEEYTNGHVQNGTSNGVSNGHANGYANGHANGHVFEGKADLIPNSPVPVEEEEIDRGGRETWKGQFDFLMTLIGLSVGTGNIWRFPYLCFRNGGGVFFIPYFISLVCAGIPLLFLEISIGQFMTRSGLSTWDLCPIIKGVGIATTIVTMFLNVHYIIVLTWALYYMYESLTLGDLPWENCKENWESCYKHAQDATGNVTAAVSSAVGNATQFVMDAVNTTEAAGKEVRKSPAESFWEYEVLGLSTGISDLGNIQTHLLIALVLAWIIVYCCIIRGVATTGKVVWFTGLFPYVMLIVLFIRGITLEGAGEGAMYYIKPNMTKLLEGQVWLDAGTQIFYSMSLATGSMTAMGSFNTYRHNCLRDTLIYSCVNSITSIFGGFCIFFVLGHMANQMGVPVSDVAKGGPGLTFVAYPTAVAMMPGAQIWAILFFVMILFLGLDSQFVAVEGCVAQIMDAFPQLFQFKKSREIFLTGVVIISFFIGLTMITNGGMYLFQIFDFYSASGVVLLAIAFAETVAIAYGYGGRRYCRDMKAMLGVKIPIYFPICWYFCGPIFMIFILFMFCFNYEPLSYGDYKYPAASAALGWVMSLSSCIMIPGGIVVQIYRFRHDLSRLFVPVLSKHQIHAGTRGRYIIRGTENQPEKYAGIYQSQDSHEGAVIASTPTIMTISTV